MSISFKYIFDEVPLILWKVATHFIFLAWLEDKMWLPEFHFTKKNWSPFIQKYILGIVSAGGIVKCDV